MARQRLAVRFFLAWLWLGSALPFAVGAPAGLEAGWADPPISARLRAYWWWLNGNVTTAAITRDLEEMKAKGFGGALLCDAGGAEQDGNAPVPHGPTFFSPEWRELYQHTLREANRLGLEISLNILSGWNLGGPMVKPAEAAKKLVWSEARASGPQAVELELPTPRSRDSFYQDLFVVAYPVKSSTSAPAVFAGLTASSEQRDHPATAAGDGHAATFWVSAGTAPGQGPDRARPEWLQLTFTRPITANHLMLEGRTGYGPRDCELQQSDNTNTFRTIKTFTLNSAGRSEVGFPLTTAQVYRVMIFSSFDPRSADRPRNVQVAEVQLRGPEGAWPSRAGGRQPLEHWEEKAVYRALHFSAPDSSPLFQEFPEVAGEEDTRSSEVVDLTSHVDADGKLRWQAPPGDWQVLRFGCTIGDNARVSTCSEGWQGYALDVLDAEAFRRYWNAVVEPLIADAGPLAGKTLKYLHTDSWEVEAINWTPSMRTEFRKRRGYELLPFLPVLAGRIVDRREISDRFLADYRKTIGDLAIDHHYRLFRDYAHRHGLEIHPESGGPHAVPIDAQRCLGWDDAPMSEFWAWSWRHRVGDTNRFFVKQPASAAHTYGRRLVLAEGFTSIGPHWQETLWDNLKPSFDRALCEGLNLLVWHAFVCSPEAMGIPGQQYFAGTHFNPNTTWWPESGAFLGYIDRCQFLLQQGLFVADACYYYGDHVPNFAQLKRSDPARVLPGYDYDVLTEEALLTRLSVKRGRLVLPDGLSYRVLVLPERTVISLPVLRKLKVLVAAGATVIGPRPTHASGLADFPRCDAEVEALGRELWGAGPAEQAAASGFPVHRYGNGRVVWERAAREVLLAEGVPPDFAFELVAPERRFPPEPRPTHHGISNAAPARLDYIHRSLPDADIYFVANPSNGWQRAKCTFRVADKAPEIWDAVSGRRMFARAYAQKDGRTTVPLEFAPCGSWFVVFREPAANHPPSAEGNWPDLKTIQELTGAWTVSFDPRWGGPPSARFDELVNWPTRPEPGIEYYSGKATYRKSIDLGALDAPVSGSHHRRRFLNLGLVYELARVRLNGRDLGVVWAPPFRVEITDVLKPSGNQLEVDVVNFWPNRIIGDQSLPPEQQFTRTNIRKLTRDTPLMESGLLGPVRLEQEE